MLNIEIVKFEAQDVITASGVADPCANGHNVKVTVANGQLTATCQVCGKTASGTSIDGGDLQ